MGALPLCPGAEQPGGPYAWGLSWLASAGTYHGGSEPLPARRGGGAWGVGPFGGVPPCVGGWLGG